MCHVYFKRDTANVHHDKAYICCNSKMLGHLSVEVAEAVHELQCDDGSRQNRPEIKLLGYAELTAWSS